MITIIVSYDEARHIEGKVPSIEELQPFIGERMPVLMGRKTWDLLPAKPFSRRTNIVISRTKHDMTFYHPFEPFWATSLEAALRILMNMESDNDVFIIGGVEVFQEVLEKQIAHKVIVLETKDVWGDAVFPELLGWQSKVVREGVKEYEIAHL